MNDQFIQLQLKGVDDDINKLLLNFDLVLRVDDNGVPVSFAIENFEKREIAIDYISLK